MYDTLFPSRLKETRILRGYNLEELAEKVNKKFGTKLNKGTISKYENGTQEPMISAVKYLALTLEVSTDYLTGKENGKDENTLLPKDELDILKEYRKLSQLGKFKLVAYISDLNESPRNISTNPKQQAQYNG